MAGAEDFRSRMEALADHVGHGVLIMKVAVDQVYAKYQELREDLHHPHGGRDHALQQALYDQINAMMRELADKMLDAEGLREAGRVNAERMAQRYFETAPFEFGDLRASPSPSVLDDGEEVYHRPPGVGRLDTEDLRAKGILRQLGFGNDVSNEDVLGALGAG